MKDILSLIIEKRIEDIKLLGYSFGADIPKKREYQVSKFLSSPTTILEIKRASPSKGDIDINLKLENTVKLYENAGTKAISVLTERNFFKGSLSDLIKAKSIAPHISFLRKDFILENEEIEISFLAGADAVLLIARILETEKLIELSKLCLDFCITPFIEVREHSDIEKLKEVAKVCGYSDIVFGVNSRDLKTFKVDILKPVAVRSVMKLKCVFESGTMTVNTVRFAKSFLFDGILIGEASVRYPERVPEFVKAFQSEKIFKTSFWKKISEKAEQIERNNKNIKKPIIKICGITNIEDALYVSSLGVDILGFVFAESKRKVCVKTFKEIYSKLKEAYKEKMPMLVGVITDKTSNASKEALALFKEGLLDALQYHDFGFDDEKEYIDEDIGFCRYFAIRVGNEEDIKKIDLSLYNGEPRVLIDSKVLGVLGGSGQTIDKALVSKIKEKTTLWLSGGINPYNVEDIIKSFSPELIDLSSGIEEYKGKKDFNLVKMFFDNINKL